MKVAITFELTDDQRLAVGVKETGLFILATRKEARDFLTQAANAELNSITAKVVAKMDQMREELQVSIDASLRGE